MPDGHPAFADVDESGPPALIVKRVLDDWDAPMMPRIFLQK